ncbi:MAG: hypothetical protein JRN20_15670 [Nitrososphaerota archaeon]|nr:hypothetical protein [Nitrososphaerota archaeon]
MLAISRVLSIVVVIVIILIIFVTLVIVANGTVTKTEIVGIYGYRESRYVVSGTCTYGPSTFLNVSTYTTTLHVRGIGFHTKTTTATAYGISSIITTTTVTNTTSLGTYCPS